MFQVSGKYSSLCSGLLIGAISPLLQSLDQTLTVIMLPDYTTIEISTFLSQLTSDKGPRTNEDHILFKSLLKLFCQTDHYQLEIVSEDLKSELDDKDTSEDLKSELDIKDVTDFLPEIDAQCPESPPQKILSPRKKVVKGKHTKKGLLQGRPTHSGPFETAMTDLNM